MTDLPHELNVVTEARGKGTLLGYEAFADGRFEVASPTEAATLMTTMLTDVATDLWDHCRELDPQVTRRVIQPNSFTSTVFVIAYEADDFNIEIRREIRSALLAVIPGMAERPKSYKVTLRIRTRTPETGQAIVEFLRGHCTHRKLTVT